MQSNTEKKTDNVSRRDFIKLSAAAGVTSLLSGTHRAYAQGSDKLRVGLIGCGGRGTGNGIIDCAASSEGIELVAMGDLFKDKLDAAPARIKNNLEKNNLPVKEIFKVTPQTAFAGFDAFEKVIACDVDMVILTEPPYFRPGHFKAAVEAGKHVFMEKPVAVDPVGVRTIIASSELAQQKGLSVVAGTQSRRLAHMMEIMKRINRGDIGEIQAGACFRLGDGMSGWGTRRRTEWSDMEWQIRNWLFYTWLSGDFIAEMHIHNLDQLNWAMGSHPVKCVGRGGRQSRTDDKYGNIFDHITAEYEYPNGARISYMGCQIDNCSNRMDLRLIGTRGQAYVDFALGKIEGQNAYQYEGPSPNPNHRQYAELVDSIRQGEPLNEGRRVAESTMTAIMGRMSAYTGRALQWKWAMEASKLDLSPPKMEFGDLPEPPVAIPGVTKLI
jgi:predicted dehydrogenase